MSLRTPPRSWVVVGSSSGHQAYHASALYQRRHLMPRVTASADVVPSPPSARVRLPDRRHPDAEIGAYPAYQDGDRPDDIRSGREVARRFPCHSPAGRSLETDKSLIWKRYRRNCWPNSRFCPCCMGSGREESSRIPSLQLTAGGVGTSFGRPGELPGAASPRVSRTGAFCRPPAS